MSRHQEKLIDGSKQSGRKKSEAEFKEFIETCFDEGWFPTKCLQGCVVEPDGICPHNFKSIILELGLT